MKGFYGPDLSSLGRVRTKMEALQRVIEGTDRTAFPEKSRFVEVLDRTVSGGTETARISRSGLEEVPISGYAGETEVLYPSGDPGGEDVDSIIRRKASQYKVDEALVRSVVRMESGGDPRAVSKAGAMGVMQLMPGTAEMLGVVDPFDPEQNVDGGVRYLKKMLGRYCGDETKALAAYHSGPGNVDRYGGVPPHPAVDRYVKCVLSMTRREREGR
jgi:soluble lytic murein transglycosylase-like protein